MTEYAAGTVAVATVRGVPNVRVAYADSKDASMPWIGLTGVDADRWVYASEVADVRPLIMLDLDGISPDELVRSLREYGKRNGGDGYMHALADQIEAQTKPPRIPEPGLYGVVEATVDGADRRRFCHLEDDGEGWSGAGAWFYWRDLTDPKLIRPGIEDES